MRNSVQYWTIVLTLNDCPSDALFESYQFWACITIKTSNQVFEQRKLTCLVRVIRGLAIDL